MEVCGDAIVAPLLSTSFMFMHKIFFAGLSVSLLALAACSSQSTPTITDDASSAMMSSSSVDAMMPVSSASMMSADSTMSVSSSSVAAMENNEGTKADSKTDAVGQ